MDTVGVKEVEERQRWHGYVRQKVERKHIRNSMQWKAKVDSNEAMKPRAVEY